VAILEATGVDGSTLLGFLAAVGSLRLLQLRAPKQRPALAFDLSDFHAQLRLEDASPEEIGALLASAALDRAVAETFMFADAKGQAIPHPNKMTADDVRRIVSERADSRLALDVLSGLIADDAKDDGEAVPDTALRAVGGGRLQFFKQIECILSDATKEDAIRSLTSPWSHRDAKGGMRWAHEEDRRQALRATDPSAEEALGERGANALAIHALPIFTVLPSGKTLSVSKKHAVSVSWPLWSPFASFPTVRALIATARTDRRDELRRRGSFHAFQAQRISNGQYRNFSPSTALW